jgi:hypothetical protein
MKRSRLTVLMCFISLPANAADTTQAVKVHMECVMSNAMRIDDGRMAATRLAEMIRPLCRAKHEAAMQASLGQSWNTTPKAKARELELNHTVAAVALYRSRIPGR